MLLSCRFDVEAGEVADFRAAAHLAVGLLSAQAGCVAAWAGRSVDGSDGAGQVWTLLARFESVTAYRRALAPFEVRTHVVPLLARARDDGASTVEVLIEGADGTVLEHESLLVGDDTPPASDGGPRAGKPGAHDR